MSGKRKRGAVKIVISVALAVFLFSLLIFALYKVDFINVLEFIPSIFQKNDPDPGNKNSEKINELTELLEKTGGEYERSKLDTASAIAILSVSPSKESYYHSYVVSYMHGKNVLEKNFYVTRSKDNWSVTSREGGAPGQTVGFDGNEYTVTDNATAEKRTFSKESNMTFEGQTWLTPISEIKELLSEYNAALKSGGEPRISDVSAELFRTETDNIVLLDFKYVETGQEEEYMIQLDYGVILSASVSLSGEQYYNVTTTVFNPNYGER